MVVPFFVNRDIENNWMKKLFEFNVNTSRMTRKFIHRLTKLGLNLLIFLQHLLNAVFLNILFQRTKHICVSKVFKINQFHFELVIFFFKLLMW